MIANSVPREVIERNQRLAPPVCGGRRVAPPKHVRDDGSIQGNQAEVQLKGRQSGFGCSIAAERRAAVVAARVNDQRGRVRAGYSLADHMAGRQHVPVGDEEAAPAVQGLPVLLVGDRANPPVRRHGCIRDLAPVILPGEAPLTLQGDPGVGLTARFELAGAVWREVALERAGCLQRRQPGFGPVALRFPGEQRFVEERRREPFDPSLAPGPVVFPGGRHAALFQPSAPPPCRP